MTRFDQTLWKYTAMQIAHKKVSWVNAAFKEFGEKITLWVIEDSFVLKKNCWRITDKALRSNVKLFLSFFLVNPIWIPIFSLFHFRMSKGLVQKSILTFPSRIDFINIFLKLNFFGTQDEKLFFANTFGEFHQTNLV